MLFIDVISTLVALALICVLSLSVVITGMFVAIRGSEMHGRTLQHPRTASGVLAQVSRTGNVREDSEGSGLAVAELMPRLQISYLPN